jgi:hypothetical protein
MGIPSIFGGYCVFEQDESAFVVVQNGEDFSFLTKKGNLLWGS